MVESTQIETVRMQRIIFRKPCEPRVILCETCEFRVKFRNVSFTGLPDRDESGRAVGNGRENTSTTFVFRFYTREREREREHRSGKRNRIYGMSETGLFNREYVDNGWESGIQIGKIAAYNYFEHLTCCETYKLQQYIMHK